MLHDAIVHTLCLATLNDMYDTFSKQRFVFCALNWCYMIQLSIKFVLQHWENIPSLVAVDMIHGETSHCDLH